MVLLLSPGSAPLLAVPPNNTLVGKPAPTFARPSLDHRRIDIAAFRGRVVLLNFWATWCASCQTEMPRFIEWQEKYNAEGLSIVGVSMDDDPALAVSLVHKLRLNYPVVMGDEKLGLAYGGVLGLPVSYLIDRRGIIRARFGSETDLDAMKSAIKTLLQSH